MPRGCSCIVLQSKESDPTSQRTARCDTLLDPSTNQPLRGMDGLPPRTSLLSRYSARTRPRPRPGIFLRSNMRTWRSGTRPPGISCNWAREKRSQMRRKSEAERERVGHEAERDVRRRQISETSVQASDSISLLPPLPFDSWSHT